MSSDPKATPDLKLDEKRALLAEQLLLKARAPKSFPASFAQRRLWFLDQLSPGNSIYNIPVSIRLRGPLDVPSMERTLSEIARRHQSLRTIFSEVSGELQQVIAPRADLTLPIIDNSDVAEAQREEASLRFATEEAQRPFDLANGPLLRVGLLRQSQEDHILLLTMHHIISDGWSAGVLMREIGMLYDAFSKGKPSPLPPLPVQYADYAVWQRKKLQGEHLEQLLDYWRLQLAGAPPLLEIATDRPRPAVQNFRGSSYSFSLSQEIAKAAREFSQREGATLFMTLLAAFQALLSRYSGQDDIVVGTPIANRNHVDTEGLIGFFVNTLVLRGRLSNDPSFREFLQQLRATALEAYAHQDMPFEELVKDLQPERNLSYSPLFQVMFTLQNVTRQTLKLAGLNLDSVKTENTTAKFELVMEVEENEQGLRVTLQYNTGLFDRATVERLAGHYRTLVESALINPDLRISRLPLLTEPECRQFLFDWNDTARPLPPDATATKLFEVRVGVQPQAVAVVGDKEQLTYAELNGKANQLAAYLRKLGVGEEARVGILMEQSVEMIVALLGVLKAGAAYVPIQPQSPPEQLVFMLNDAQVSILITEDRLAAVAQGRVSHLIRLDTEWGNISVESEYNPPACATLDSLISVLYGFGSMGKLIGTMIDGRGALNACLWNERFSGFTAQSRSLAGMPLSLDCAFQNIMTSLIAGGRLILTKSGDDNAATLLKRIEEEKVTALSLFPQQAYATIDAAAADHYKSLSSVECLTLVGEAPSPAKLRGWLKSENCNCRLVNSYSLTECSGALSAYSAKKEEVDFLDALPAGRPIDNACLYVLDKHRALVPVGVAGELCVSGDLLARGYLNRPELTAQTFIPHPFIPEKKMFLTGDRARFRSGGQLEVLGRLDPTQVRIRGILIDLGEIEAVLHANESIREAVVLAREDQPGMERLVAYLVPHEGSETPTSSELHQHLRQTLPVFMVPSVFVTLDELPLTSVGKINRQALPAPEALTSELIETFVAPRSPIEQHLANLWAGVLGVERVGVHDNFFGLGGHSLLATQVISRIREEFGVAIPLQQIFETPTVAGLALALEARQATSDDEGDKIERVSLDDEQLLERLDQLSDEDITALLMLNSSGAA